MGVLKGAAVNLDDLIGFTKLQNVLAMFLGHMNEQDSAILQLKDQCEQLSAKLKDEQGMADALASQKAMADMLASQAFDLAQLKKREEEQDRELVSLRRLLDDTSALAKEQVTKLEVVRVASDKLVERESVQDGLIEDLRLAAASYASADSLEDLERRMLELSESVARLCEEIEALRPEPQEEAAGPPEGDTGGPPTETAEDPLLRLQERLELLEEWVAALQATVNGDLPSRIQAVAEKEDRDVRHLSRQLADIRNQLLVLTGPGSSATSSRCLTCFDVRLPVQNRVVVGSDGKTYKRRPSTGVSESVDVTPAPRPKSAGAAGTRRIARPGGTGLPLPGKAPGVRDRPQTASSGVSTNAPSNGTSHYVLSRPASDPSFLSSEPAAEHALIGNIGGINRVLADGE